jgi:cytochrome oxidase Cu insertion factor (SCO1/SenC/PrrC family)
MKRSPLVFALALLVSATVAYASWVVMRNLSQRQSSPGEMAAVKHADAAPGTPAGARPAMIVEEPGEPLPTFVLTERSGETFDSASLRGKVWVGNFFFVSCPGSCWKLSSGLAHLHRDVTSDDLKIVSITCDPANDTLPKLREYADNFGASADRWFFLTGEMDELKRIGNQVFKMAVETQTHTDRAMVVDRQGRLRGTFNLTDPNQVVALQKFVRELLREPPPAAEASLPFEEVGRDADG